MMMTHYFHLEHIKVNILMGCVFAGEGGHLSTAPTVMFPADDGEGSLAGNAGVAGFIWDPIWGVLREPVKK